MGDVEVDDEEEVVEAMGRFGGRRGSFVRGNDEPNEVT